MSDVRDEAARRSRDSGHGNDEVIVHPPAYGGYHRETIYHHEGCVVRGVGTACGCEPIRVSDFITPCDCSRGQGRAPREDER